MSFLEQVEQPSLANFPGFARIAKSNTKKGEASPSQNPTGILTNDDWKKKTQHESSDPWSVDSAGISTALSWNEIRPLRTHQLFD